MEECGQNKFITTSTGATHSSVKWVKTVKDLRKIVLVEAASAFERPIDQACLAFVGLDHALL